MIIALIFYTFILWTLQSNHVVFKEIREITGAISHIHLFLPIYIPGLKERGDHYIQQVQGLKKATLDRKFQSKGNEYYELQYTKDIWAS